MELGTQVILDKSELQRLVEDYLEFDEFVFDVETVPTRPSRDLPEDKGKALKDDPGLDAMSNRVFWISFAGPGRADVLPLGHTQPGPKQMDPDVAWDLLEDLFYSDRVKVGANVKFDLSSTAKYYGGEVPPPPYEDILTMAHILDENLYRHGGNNLENISKLFNKYTYKEKLGVKVAKASFEKAARYSFLDAKNTWLARRFLLPRIEANPNFQFLFDLEMGVLEALIEMYRVGAYVDRSGFYREYEKHAVELSKLEDRVFEVAGTTFNPRSSQQRAAFFYETLGLRCDFFTEQGNQSTNAEALRALAKKSPVAKALVDYGKMSKLVSQYFKGFIPHIQPDDRIRAHYKGTGPVTGRLACGRPNVQNIPIRRQEGFDSTVVRKLFIAPEDLGEEYVLLVGDYSQIELRVMAHQSQDPMLLKAYVEGIDLHALTASMVYSVEIDKVEKWMRAIGKTSNFNFAFEGSAARVIEAVEQDGGHISVREAKRVFDAWHRAYPNVKKWGAYQKQHAREFGYVETLYGRRRRLPEIRYKGTSDETRKKVAFAEREAVNHPIQGSAADIAKIALVRIDQAFRGTKASLVMQIHDEFIVQAPKSFEEEGIALMREAMEGVKREGKPPLRVPLIADIHSGRTWVEAK